MSWQGLLDLDDWRTRLAVEGRFEIAVRRWPALLLGLFGASLGPLMVWAAVLGFADSEGVLVAGVCACSGALLALSGLRLLAHCLRPGPVLVVRPDGLELTRLKLRVPWSGISDVTARRYGYHVVVVEVRLEAAFRDHVLRERPVPWHTRLRRSRRWLTLPWPLAADVPCLVELLDELRGQARR
ncbi:hypothetical protein ACFP3Q_12270 [Nocardioides sp. GCM10027113]|uniref:hypothetical protein n=1 Tax=unclassified Nocardioides TaxID=2615069 RepID=UPI00360616BB